MSFIEVDLTRHSQSSYSAAINLLHHLNFNTQTYRSELQEKRPHSPYCNVATVIWCDIHTADWMAENPRGPVDQLNSRKMMCYVFRASGIIYVLYFCPCGIFKEGMFWVFSVCTICLYVFMFVCRPSVYLSVYLSVCLSVCLFMCIAADAMSAAYVRTGNAESRTDAFVTHQHLKNLTTSQCILSSHIITQT